MDVYLNAKLTRMAHAILTQSQWRMLSPQMYELLAIMIKRLNWQALILYCIDHHGISI